MDSTELHWYTNLQALITEREGMVAENEQRQIEGKSLAYTEEAFAGVQSQMEQIAEQIRKYS